MPRGRTVRQIDTSHDEDVARLHAAGKGRNDISRELEIPAGTVSNIAKRLGLKFDGSQVLMATEVRRREAAERRAILTLSLLDEAEALLARLHQPITYVQYGGRDFERVEDTPDEPTPQDQAHLARAATMLIDRSIRLDEYDKIGAGMEDAINFLDGVTVTIRGFTAPELESGDGSDDRTEP